MNRRIAALILPLAFLLAVLAACGAEQGSPEDTDRPPDSAAHGGEAEPTSVPAPVNPLTGIPVPEDIANRRPVAVMLNNVKRAQPQLGISEADIIYEVPAEGGVTRMLALYQDVENVETLGSIRSARPYYLEIALGHDAVLVHAGGSEEAYRDIDAWDMDHMDGVRGGSDAKIFWRDPDRRSKMGYEHSLLTSGKNIQDYLDAGHFRTEHPAEYVWTQTFTKDGAPADGTAADYVEVRFPGEYKTGIFEYNARLGEYEASQYGAAQTDGNTGKQVSVTNLLVLETDMTVLDREGRLRVVTSGVGSGIFCCGGKSIPVRWQKADRNAPFLYTLTDGTPLVLGQGRSYVCIIDPQNGGVTARGASE